MNIHSLLFPKCIIVASTAEDRVRSLESCYESLDSAVTWCITIVVLGVLFEAVPIIVEFIEERRNSRTPHTTAGRLALHLGGIVLVVGGVAGELWLHRESGKTNTQLVIATNNRDAQRDSDIAERLEAAKSSLENAVWWLSPWDVDNEALARIAAKVKTYSETRFFLSTDFADRNATELSAKVARSLTNFGSDWEAVLPPGSIGPHLNFEGIRVRGISPAPEGIVINAPRSANLSAARALAAALRDEHLPAKILFAGDESIEGVSLGAMEIIIGAKPPRRPTTGGR